MRKRKTVHLACSILTELAFVLLAVCWLHSLSEQGGSGVFHLWLTVPLALLLISHLAWFFSRWYISVPLLGIGYLVLLGKELLDGVLLTIVCAQLLLYTLICVNHRKTIQAFQVQ